MDVSERLILASFIHFGSQLDTWHLQIVRICLCIVTTFAETTAIATVALKCAVI